MKRYTALPERPNAEQQRKRAKELLAGVRAGDGDALERVARHHPDGAGAPVKLAAAQLVIAREYGFASWPALTRHLTVLAREQAAVDDPRSTPDGDRPTAHVRCGSDIERGLAEARFTGSFVEFSDPYCMGPVLPLDDADFVRSRAAYLESSPGDATATTDYARELSEQLAALERAVRSRGRVVLWFEHDSYDQLILARVLEVVGRDRPDGDGVELICVDDYPGVGGFRGLGQLSPSRLRDVWRSRRQVSAEALEFGARVWSAVRAADPRELHELTRGGTPAIPPMAAALRRHLQELPWTTDGLSLSERIIVELLRQGPMRGGALFRGSQLEREPLPYLGDTMFHTILRGLAQAPAAAVRRIGDAGWIDATWELTPVGERLLAGEADWIADGAPRVRFVGGVEIRPGAASWRWSPGDDAPVAG